MTLAETLILYIGPAIAKSIIKNWLGDNLPASILASLVDSSKSEAERVLIGKQASSKIDKIAKDISTKLKPLVQGGEYKLSDEQILVVGQEVVVTLSSAKISTETLISLRLNVQKLYKHLLNSRKNATHNLSEKESRAYEFLIFEISKQIIDISTELESYERTLSAKLLDNQEQILSQLEKLIKVPEGSHYRFEQNYCSIIKQQLDKFEIFGLPQLDSISRKQSLSVAYVTLEVDRQESKISPSDTQKQNKTKTAPERNRTRSGFQKGYQDKSDPEVVDDLLLDSRRIIIIGDAGSGKSTLMQWIAVKSAGGDFQESLSSLNNTVPFFIRLREHVDSGFPNTENFPAQIARMIAGDMPKGWVHEQLDNGRAFVLIDGVDELPINRRNEMLQGLKQLLASYPLARYIVTSRPSALKPEDWLEWSDWVKSENFSEVRIRPMSPRHVDIFIDQWHKAFSQTTGDVEEKAEINALAPSLKRLLKHRPPLRRLASNPLLCAMICALHKDRQQNLPAERIELYKACVEMLLSRRDEGRKIVHSDYPELSSSQKLSLIQSFAYWLIQNSYSDVEYIEADRYFSEKLQMMNLANHKGESARKFFVERTSLLREPVMGRIDFAHRTFQEFLAAQTAAKLGDIGLMLKNSRDDQWKEVIVLAAGETRPKETEKLLTGLINKGKKLKSTHNQNQLFLLAISCLETCIELSPTVRSLVMKSAKNVLPPKNQDDAKMLAAAGDPIVELLEYNEKFEELSNYCVQTLAMIGTDKALKTLQKYASSSKNISIELAHAWNSFDREAYAKLIFPHCRELFFDELDSLEYFDYLVNLNRLSISKGEKIKDLAQFKHLKKLKALNLLSLKVTSLDSLSDLTNLKEFWLQNSSSVSNLEPLSKLPHLDNILLHNCPAIVDLTPLSHLSMIEELFLSDMSLGAIQSLYKLQNVKTLVLINHSRKPENLDYFDGLSKMVALESLDIGEVSERIKIDDLLIHLKNFDLPKLTTVKIRKDEYQL